MSISLCICSKFAVRLFQFIFLILITNIFIFIYLFISLHFIKNNLVRRNLFFANALINAIIEFVENLSTSYWNVKKLTFNLFLTSVFIKVTKYNSIK